MHSVLLESPLVPATKTSRTLLVLWRHPATREILPIGRLVRNASSGYTFNYTKATEDIHDFRPLAGLPSLTTRYESIELHPVFAQRVMGSGREDFGDYVRNLGLTEEQATPWEQIVHSGGHRAGDTLQFMEEPRILGGRLTSRFLVNGVRHIPDDTLYTSSGSHSISHDELETALAGVEIGDQLQFVPEIGNDTDGDAMLAFAGDVPVGWAPRILSSSLRELSKDGSIYGEICHIGDPLGSPRLRLTVDLNVGVPPGFQLDRLGRWEPRATA